MEKQGGFYEHSSNSKPTCVFVSVRLMIVTPGQQTCHET